MRKLSDLVVEQDEPEEIPMKTTLMTLLTFIGALAMNAFATTTATANDTEHQAAKTTPLDLEMKTLDGKTINLAKKYQGKVVLLVNVASKCGLTPQYEQLQALHEKYADQGLAIVGVPCNQFGNQEPGTAKEIAEFCQSRFGVEFDMLAKVDVNGDNAAPLYKYLTSEETNPKFGGKISWNFEKFLFNRQGQLVARFSPRVKPDAPEVVAAIEAELAQGR
jgi:glutathione peroxidase